MPELQIGFVGAGRIARALARGFVQAKLADATGIIASDPSPEAIGLFAAAVPGSRAAGSNADVVSGADAVVLAVKPQQLATALAELRGGVTDEMLVVSVVAGATIATLIKGLGTRRVVRVMPNTPCLIGQGATGYAMGPGTRDGDARLVSKLFGSVGIACELPEKLLDAVTGLSGSGPGYVYTMIEALAEGAVQLGMPRETALQLAAQTVRGAAAMVIESGQEPAALRDQVTSPGGTTLAGLKALEEHGLRPALVAAVAAATKRAEELAGESSRSR
jgi:pyrroline-5-carboxylate reductase